MTKDEQSALMERCKRAIALQNDIEEIGTAIREFEESGIVNMMTGQGRPVKAIIQIPSGEVWDELRQAAIKAIKTKLDELNAAYSAL